MNNKLFIPLTALIFSVILWSCKKDTTLPELQTYGVEEFDIVQVTNSKPYLPVVLSYGDNNAIDSIAIGAYKETELTKRIAGTVIRNFVNNSTGRATVNIPFPAPKDGGNSGLYVIKYTITDKKGNTYTKSYKVNILNTQTAPDSNCEGSFPSTPLPAGKNVWLYVTAPASTEGEDLYVSGNFEESLACGTGNWSGGGNQCLKLTKVQGSNTCYYIALNLTNSAEFKITRGSWNTVMKAADGSEIKDNLKWNGQTSQFYRVLNWADRVQLPPVSLPDSLIASGKITALIDVKNDDQSIEYFLVKKGDPLTNRSIPLIRVAGTTKVAAVVPKLQATEYLIVKNDKKSVNKWGYEKLIKWDGKTNPIEATVEYFEGDKDVVTPPPSLYIIGDATPGGWTAPVDEATQKFTKVSDGMFEITIALTATNEYLLFQNNVECCWWQEKVGGKEKIEGELVYFGENFKAPDQSGNYKIMVDFTKGTYKLVKQ
ncbi:MAG: hypothetical protein KGP35_04510 [Bacteroidetes bacterium]|nr:hypothetical protein [Bacteroidota bacterium]